MKKFLFVSLALLFTSPVEAARRCPYGQILRVHEHRCVSIRSNAAREIGYSIYQKKSIKKSEEKWYVTIMIPDDENFHKEIPFNIPGSIMMRQPYIRR